MVAAVHLEQSQQRRDQHTPHELPDEPEECPGFPIPDESYWDVFIPDDDEIDPLPAPGDFWIEPAD